MIATGSVAKWAVGKPEALIGNSTTGQGDINPLSTTSPSISAESSVLTSVTPSGVTISLVETSAIVSVSVQGSLPSLSVSPLDILVITTVGAIGELPLVSITSTTISAGVYVLTDCSLPIVSTIPVDVTVQTNTVVSAALTVVTLSSVSASTVITSIAPLELAEITIDTYQGTVIVFEVVSPSGSLPQVNISELTGEAISGCIVQGDLQAINIIACSAAGGDLSNVFIDIVLINSAITTEQNILSDICTELTISSASTKLINLISVIE